MKKIFFTSISKRFSFKIRSFGLITIPEGESCIVWDKKGKTSIIEGPKRIFNFFNKIEQMNLFVANSSQYLSILKKSGENSFVRGPTSLYFNPVEHSQITVLDMLKINSNEAIVVYREKESNVIDRSVIYGPKEYCPIGKEWFHKFSWHGHDRSSNNICRKVPNALRFEVLRLMPDQLYFDIENVRTKDDALVTINTMIFYQLEDILKMVDTTHDPIAVFINNISADLIEFMSSRTFEQFKSDIEVLNNSNTYKLLKKNSVDIGYKINKVVFRGYFANAKLQEMHNNAIEKRTQLVLSRETEEENQKLEDFKLEKKIQREEALNKHELDKAAHEENVKRVSFQEEMKKKIEMNEILNSQSLKQLDIENIRLIKLKELGVDLTKILEAEKQYANQVIKIEDGRRI